MARPESDYSVLQRAKQKIVNFVRRTPIPPKDTEGIATLALFDEDENCEEVVGCIVRNNVKLVQLINPKHLYVQKYKKTKYFAYFKDVPHLDYRRAVITFTNFTQSPSEIITCKVDDLVAEEKIVKGPEGDCHVFVPCESPDFNNSTFLRHYSKNVNIDQEVGPNLTAVEDKKFYGLGKDKEELICLELKRDEQTNNIFIIDSDVYDKLVGGPLFLDDKTTVVGCYAKNEEQRGITIHVFGKKEPIEAWEASLNYDQLALTAESSGGSTSSKISNQEMKDKFNPLFVNDIKPPPLDERSMNSGSDDGCTVDDVSITGKNKDGEVGDGGASVSDDDDAKDASCDKEDELYLVDLPVDSQESALNHESSLDSQESREPASNNYENSQRRVPIERDISTDQSISNGVRVHTEEEGTRSGTGMIPQSLRQVTLGKLCQKDSTVIQDVSLVFDKKKKEHRNVLALADRVDAHPVIKSKCNSNYDHSPASELFNLPYISMLSVREIADSLRSMQRVNLAEKIEEKVSESDMLKEVEVVLLNDYRYHDLFEEVTTTLDDGSFRNWRHLGKQLQIKDHILDHIETNTNPAERFLVDYAYIALIRQKLKLSQLYQHMTTLGREDEISILFGKCGITKDDPRSMKVVFQPNSNAMEGLGQLLNLKSPCKGWQNLAHLWDVPPEKYFYYIPDTTASATRILLEWLMMAHPEFTVFELLEHLYELERHDVYEVLEKKLLKAYSAPNGTIAI